VSARGTTLVVVTHETAPLAGVLTRAVVVDHGRIAYDGPLPPGHALDEAHAHHHPHPAPVGTRRAYRMDQPTVTTRARGAADEER
jgi:zinc transport system ATP-binding protein